MSVYALRDEERGAAGVLACLTCNEETGEFSLEVAPEADPLGSAAHPTRALRARRRAIDAAWSARQSLDEVLRANGLAAYDELSLLQLAEGRCAPDACYLTQVSNENPPAWHVPLDRGIAQ